MTYAQPFLRLSFGGSLAGGNEIWSCNLHLITIGTVVSPETWLLLASDALPAVGDILEAYVANPAVLVPNDVKLDWVKLALIGTDGKYMAEAYEQQLDGQGSQAESYLPQASLVNTMVSSKWKDPGRYNRFYLPITINAFPEGAYSLTEFAQTAYLTELKEFIEDINTAFEDIDPGYDTRVGVVSNTASGSQDSVYSVRLGRIVDTQRRRRNALNEAYQQVNVDQG